MASAADGDLLDACRAEDRALVTLRSDLSNPSRSAPSPRAGTDVLRLPRRPTHPDLEAAARTRIAAPEKESIVGRLWSVGRGRVRVYEESGG